jgi:hypothetical protein
MITSSQRRRRSRWRPSPREGVTQRGAAGHNCVEALAGEGLCVDTVHERSAQGRLRYRRSDWCKRRRGCLQAQGKAGDADDPRAAGRMGELAGTRSTAASFLRSTSAPGRCARDMPVPRGHRRRQERSSGARQQLLVRTPGGIPQVLVVLRTRELAALAGRLPRSRTYRGARRVGSPLSALAGFVLPGVLPN